MATVRVYFQGDRVGPKLQKTYGSLNRRMLEAARAAAQDVSDEILKLGRSDIASAGRYGTRWTRGLHAPVSEGGGSIRVGVTHDIPYFRAPLYGATIRGKPLLWIPLPWNRSGVRARDYPGRLFRVPRGSSPFRRGGGPALLLDRGTRRPQYFAKKQVVLPKKFHTNEIARDAARRMNEFYRVRFSALR